MIIQKLKKKIEKSYGNVIFKIFENPDLLYLLEFVYVRYFYLICG